jgi:hypothetical protein
MLQVRGWAATREKVMGSATDKLSHYEGHEGTRRKTSVPLALGVVDVVPVFLGVLSVRIKPIAAWNPELSFVLLRGQ